MFRTFTINHVIDSTGQVYTEEVRRYFPVGIGFVYAFETNSQPVVPVHQPLPYVVHGEMPYLDIIVACSAARKSIEAFTHLKLTIVFRHDPDRLMQDYGQEITSFDRIIFCEPLPLSDHEHFAVKKRLNGPFEVSLYSAVYFRYTWNCYAPPTEYKQTGFDPNGAPIFGDVPIEYKEHIKITLIAPPTKGILYDNQQSGKN